MTDPFGLSGRRVVLTGGSSGIGLGLAKVIAAAGARLTVLALPDGIEALDGIGDKASILACDITDRDAVFAAMSKVGNIDVLIANAGLERLTPVDDRSDEASDTFAKVLAAKLHSGLVQGRTPTDCISRCLPTARAMRRRSDGLTFVPSRRLNSRRPPRS